MSVISDDSPKRRRQTARHGSPRRSDPRRQAVPKAKGQTSTAVEDTFWARLEDREEGRLVIEADHLFDTSYAWAV